MRCVSFYGFVYELKVCVIRVQNPQQSARDNRPIIKIAAQSVCRSRPAKNEFVLAFFSYMSTHAARYVALIPSFYLALRYTPLFTT